MNDFDDEAGTGGGYERIIVRPLVAQDGIARRTVLRFRGRPVERVSVVLEEIREGQLGSLVRYDDAHGQFHRHAPGWPEPFRAHRGVPGSTSSTARRVRRYRDTSAIYCLG